MDTRAGDVSYIDRDTLSGFQLLVVTLCALINILDGFDALAIAYTAPPIAEEWGLSPGTLGTVFSAGYLGMAIGALALGSLSDRIGRRMNILISMAVITVFMGLTATVGSVGMLIAYRFCTGLAIGSMLASITALAAEYAPDTKRNLIVSIVQGTYAVGATVGGLFAAVLIEDHGWRSVFGVGAALNGIMLVLLLAALPESLAFLLARRPAGGLAKVNAIVTRLGHPALSHWPALAETAPGATTGVRALFQGEMKRWSPLLWVATFSAMFASYFLLSWIPKIIVDAGLSLDNAILVGIAVNTGALVGIIWLGYRSATRGLRPLITIFFVVAGILMIVFGSLDTGVAALMGIATALGFFGMGGFIGLYAVAARLYPTGIRATGIGWAIGLGRVGAIAGPFAGGILIGLGLGQATYFAVLSLPFFTGAVAVWMLRAPQLVPAR